MKNLLTGNGINIQFDHANYTTQQIVLRILKNCDRDDFPSHIIVNFPYLLKNYLGQLFLETSEIIDGYYEDTSVPLTDEDKIEVTDAIVKRADELKSMGLGVPQITDFMKQYYLKGNDIKQTVLTVEEGRDEILRYLRSKSDA